MFEDFRQQAVEDAFEDLEAQNQVAAPPRSNRFLGMTPPQRFIIALMLLMMTIILGTLCLLVTERMVPVL